MAKGVREGLLLAHTAPLQGGLMAPQVPLLFRVCLCSCVVLLFPPSLTVVPSGVTSLPPCPCWIHGRGWQAGFAQPISDQPKKTDASPETSDRRARPHTATPTVIQQMTSLLLFSFAAGLIQCCHGMATINKSPSLIRGGSSPHVLWKIPTGPLLSPQSGGSPVQIFGSTAIVFANDTSVYKIDLAGRLLWETRVGYTAKAVAAHSNVVVLLADTLSSVFVNSTLFALNGSTGELIWTYVAPVGCCPNSSFSDGFALSSDGTTIALATYPGRYENVTGIRAADGLVLWSFGTWAGNGPKVSVFSCSPGVFCVGTMDCNVYALAQNGTQLWVDEEDMYLAFYAFLNGVLFSSMTEASDPFHPNQGFLNAYAPVTGELFSLVSWLTPDGTFAFPVLSASNDLLFTYDNTQSSVFNASNGALLWNCTLCGRTGVFGVGTQFFTSAVENKSLCAYDGVSGSFLWSAPNAGSLLFASLVHVIVAASVDGQLLLGLNDTTGTLLWAHPVTNVTTLQPYANDAVAVTTGDGSILLYQLTTGELTWRLPLTAPVSAYLTPNLIIAVSEDGIYGLQ